MKSDDLPWCNDRGRCERHPLLDHYGCHGHSTKTGEPCRIGWNCPHHGEPPWTVLAGIGSIHFQADQRYRRLLEPKSPDELRKVIAACDHLNQTNCWWATYHARGAVRAIASELLYSHGMRLMNALAAIGGPR